MNIELEHLKLIPTILKQIESMKLQKAMSSEKRWLNTRELADYVGYSIDSINKMVQEQVFQQDVHYYKPSKKLLFDKPEVDNWVLGIDSEVSKKNVATILDDILSSMKNG